MCVIIEIFTPKALANAPERRAVETESVSSSLMGIFWSEIHFTLVGQNLTEWMQITVSTCFPFNNCLKLTFGMHHRKIFNPSNYGCRRFFFLSLSLFFNLAKANYIRVNKQLNRSEAQKTWLWLHK